MIIQREPETCGIFLVNVPCVFLSFFLLYFKTRKIINLLEYTTLTLNKTETSLLPLNTHAPARVLSPSYMSYKTHKCMWCESFVIFFFPFKKKTMVYFRVPNLTGSLDVRNSGIYSFFTYLYTLDFLRMARAIYWTRRNTNIQVIHIFS